MKTSCKNLIIPLLILLAPLKGRAQSLSQAQEAYLSGDFKKMAVSLHQALEQNPNDTLVKENALSLLSKAYEVSDAGQIPIDWRLPDEIQSMKISVKYSVKDDAQYTFRVYGETVHDKSIAQLQVIQFPDHVVLDKQAQIGSWSDTSQIDTLDHVYELQGKKSRQPVTAGLYLLNLTLMDGTQTKGWFILEDNANSTASPRVSIPSRDQVFKTGNPTFAWQNFVSPQYQPFEKRSVWVGISRSEAPDYNWDEVWGHYEVPPVSEQITIDSKGDQGSLSTLNKGSYIFFIDYHESRKFGDLSITRDSITLRNFKVSP